MNEVILSFCISSYNRYEVLKELVLELLSVESDKFDVIICDDCSSDGTVEKISRIEDKRLKIFVNEENIGGPLNICRSLDRGDGKYIFYINERDNVNPKKVEKLISVLEDLERENVAFARCIYMEDLPLDYQIFEAKKDAVLEFACHIVHPTGYIFKRNMWEMVLNRHIFFEKECYGDYGLTLVSAILSKKYCGAVIGGDICDIKRERINFSKEKSRYLKKKNDQRMWYSPEAQWRELMITYKFSKKLNVKKECIDELICRRYYEYLYRIVVDYKQIISRPSNTEHYNIKVVRSPLVIEIKSIWNGVFLWERMARFCFFIGNKELKKRIDFITKKIYELHFERFRI